jgi:peroxiredoxin
MTVKPLEPAGPKTGVLLPDFTVETMTGRTIHRREFKGRKHLVICFAPAAFAVVGQQLVTAVAAKSLAWQAERAETLVIVPGPVATDPVAIAALPTALAIVVDIDGQLLALFGVGD